MWRKNDQKITSKVRTQKMLKIAFETHLRSYTFLKLRKKCKMHQLLRSTYIQ